MEERAIVLLKTVVSMLASESKAKLYLIDLVKAQIPRGVAKILEDELRKRIDQEFKNRVELESDKKDESKLAQLVEVEWPNYVSTNITPRLQALENRINSNVYHSLRGPWEVTCN